eukprot:jgi/Botrbrau1/2853/Bobra.0036s0003.1
MSTVISCRFVNVRKPISLSLTNIRKHKGIFRSSISGSKRFVSETSCKSERKVSEPDVIQSDVSGLLPDDTERRLKKVCSIILTAEQLAPFDPGSFNVSLLLWREISAIAPAARTRLLSMLDNRSIVKLWSLAAGRYAATPAQLQESISPLYTIRQDLCPEDENKVLVYRGRAAVQLSNLLGFSKVFFKPRGSTELYGRVELVLPVVSDRIYSNFFSCSTAETVIPATGELADVGLDYESPALQKLMPEDLPTCRRWPPITSTRWPFAGLVDYMRPVGPGVYVGCGWKDPKQSLVYSKFFYFLLVRDYSSEL